MSSATEALLVLMLGAVYAFASVYFFVNRRIDVSSSRSHTGVAFASFFTTLHCAVVAYECLHGTNRWFSGLRWTLESTVGVCVIYAMETITGEDAELKIVRALYAVVVVSFLLWLFDLHIDMYFRETIWAKSIDVVGALLVFAASGRALLSSHIGVRWVGAGVLLPTISVLLYGMLAPDFAYPRSHMAITGMTFLCPITWYLLARYADNVEALRQRTISLHNAYDDLLATHRQLAQSSQMAAVGGLAAVVAHEVRNPLAIMQNAVGTLRKSAGKQVNGMLTQIMLDETARMENMARELLEFARPRPASPIDCDLRELVQRAFEAAKARLSSQEPGLVVEAVNANINIAERDAQMRLDPQLMAAAIERVVDNALRAMPSGGTLHISIAHNEKGTTLSFADEGQGMTSPVLQKIFEPFFTTRASGVGLGLTRVARAMEQHGGGVEVESVRGVGTTVHLHFSRVARTT